MNSKSSFLKALESADVPIPVANSLDVNRFHVGTQTAKQLLLEKIYTTETGERRPFRIRILIPNLRPDEDPFADVTRQELSEALRQRRTERPDSLVILHTSCYGQKKLRSWTLAFRRALEKERELGKLERLADAHDVPFVYAFQASFPTSTPFDLLTSMLYPLGTMEALAGGAGGEEILQSLMEPAPTSLVYDFFRFVLRHVPDFPIPDRVPNYAPVWNMSDSRYLKSDALEFVLRDKSGEEPDRRY